MPIIPPAEVIKRVVFGAPYVAATFNCQQDLIHSRQGPLNGFEVQQAGASLTLQPGAALIKGIAVEITAEQTLSIPGFTEPYILYITTPDDTATSNVTLDFTDAAGFNPAYVPIAEKTTSGAWRTLPYISEDFIVANTQGGIRHRTTHVMSGGETLVDVGLPYGIYTQIFDGLLVFKDGILQEKTTDWTPNGMSGITIAAAGSGDIYHLFMSDDIEWVETIVSAGGAETVSNPYNPGHHDLWVFEAGAGKQRLTTHYTETDSTTVTFVGAGTYILVKFKHNFWREVISLGGATTDQAFSNVYDASRADISVFHSTGASGPGLLMNQGSTHDYTEKSGEEIVLASGELYTGGAAADTLEIYRHRTGIPKGIGYLMAEGFFAPTAGGLQLYDTQTAVGGTPEVFTVPTYDNTGNDMQVWVNGKKLAKGHGEFTTPSTTTVSLDTLAGDQLEFIVY